MSEPEQPKGRKRKMTRQVATSFRMDERDLELIRRLAAKWDRSAASVIRQLVREAARREGVEDQEQ
jgi:hypothetical protein